MKGWIAAVAAALAMAGQAVAQPDGYVAKNGDWTTADGKPLYLYASTRAPDAKVLCGLKCPGAAAASAGSSPEWTPVLIDPNSRIASPWSAVARAEGLHLAYHGSPLFVRASDQSSEGGKWRRVPAVESEFLQVDDALLAAGPAPKARGLIVPDYPAAAWRRKESGLVALQMCVDAQGRALFPKVVRSSGSSRLDEAALEWAWRDFRLTPARVNDRHVGVCGYTYEIDWQMPEQAVEPPQ